MISIGYFLKNTGHAPYYYNQILLFCFSHRVHRHVTDVVFCLLVNLRRVDFILDFELHDFVIMLHPFLFQFSFAVPRLGITIHRGNKMELLLPLTSKGFSQTIVRRRSPRRRRRLQGLQRAQPTHQIQAIGWTRREIHYNERRILSMIAVDLKAIRETLA